MTSKRHKKGYWNYEHCKQEALKYSSRTEFEKNCGTAYNAAWKNGWLDEFVWLISQCKPSGYWTRDRVEEENKKYSLRWNFQKGCSRAYQVALKNGWLDEFTWLYNKNIKPLVKMVDSMISTNHLIQQEMPLPYTFSIQR